MQGQPPGGQVPFQPSPFASPFLPQPDDPPLLLSTSQPGGPPPPPSFQEQQQPVPSSQQAAAQAKHGPRHPSIVLVHLGLKVRRPTQLRATTHARRVSLSSPGGAITAAELRGTGTPLLTRSADAVALLPCAHRRVTPQTAGLLTYLFCGLFGSGSFVINFVAIALLQAGDFWFVKVCAGLHTQSKSATSSFRGTHPTACSTPRLLCRQNVSGRKLIGLRYWNFTNEAGENEWQFECRDGDGMALIVPDEKRMFWTTLYIQARAAPGGGHSRCK